MTKMRTTSTGGFGRTSGSLHGEKTQRGGKGPVHEPKLSGEQKEKEREQTKERAGAPPAKANLEGDFKQRRVSQKLIA